MYVVVCVLFVCIVCLYSVQKDGATDLQDVLKRRYRGMFIYVHTHTIITLIHVTDMSHPISNLLSCLLCFVDELLQYVLYVCVCVCICVCVYV